VCESVCLCVCLDIMTTSESTFTKLELACVFSTTGWRLWEEELKVRQTDAS